MRWTSGNPSNLERLQWLFNGDLAAMKAVITSARHTDDEVRKAIATLFEKYSYVADPHTAIGYLGLPAEANRVVAVSRHGSPGEVPRSRATGDQEGRAAT